jgi:nitronate monooxygenase
VSNPSKIDFDSIRASAKKVWRDICGCGRGIGVVTRVEPVAIVVGSLGEYAEAWARLGLAASEPVLTDAAAG